MKNIFEKNHNSSELETKEKIKIKYTLMSSTPESDKLFSQWNGNSESDYNVNFEELSPELQKIIFEDTEEEEMTPQFYYKELAPGKGIIFNCSGKYMYDYLVNREEIE